MTSIGFLIVILCVVTSPAWGEQCVNPPPGLTKMARGVDITSVDLVPVTGYGANGLENAVIKFTCDNGKTWRSQDGSEFQVPDQVSLVTSIPGGWLATKTSLYESSQDIRNSLTANLEMSADVKAYALSVSGSYQHLQNSITNSSKYISDLSAFEGAHQVNLVPYWELQLHPNAQSYIDKWLAGKVGGFEFNQEKYRQFIKEYGTHYFHSGNFGGFIRVIDEISSDYYNSHSESEITSNVEASYMEMISAKGGTVSGSTKVDSAFRKATSKTVKYFGGNTNLLTGGSLQEWQPTVDSDPWLYGGNLRPITDLVEDSYVKEQLSNAIKDHVLRRYLEELERLANGAKFKSNDYTFTFLLEQIKKHKDITGSLHYESHEEQIQDLAKLVHNEIAPAKWFTQNTQLCHAWKPDGNGDQCGGDADRLLCAKPNSWTPYYRDNTRGWRGSGCQMQWGLQSRGQPEWFNEVLVCLRWYSDGKSGQCGGDGADKIMCSNADSFSPVYRDNSDNRKGGCNMSWMLKVPRKAPHWMRNAKMCFNWKAEDDHSQCGNANKGKLCATANEWTETYRDDTDGRNGGCLLRWGIMLD